MGSHDIVTLIASCISIAQFCQMAAPGKELPSADADESGGEVAAEMRWGWALPFARRWGIVD
jgi:hypothetical protein